ncbi:hypothetical protein ARMGADRAFT_143952 [Armillaria gallica]|uniref:Uncharacterized protein n=1 Tax=Armillaria gallica TaxID=47427 RepID=A0A2H3DZV6_ARMGA|nr:hypothetical protein ARMGADRAFT_143952 [Armillaria gallica]
MGKLLSSNLLRHLDTCTNGTTGLFSVTIGNLTPELMKAVREDKLHRELLRTGLDDDRILRILDGQEEVPDTDVPDDASQTSTDSQASQMFLATVPGCDKLEEDRIFVPVMRIDLVLTNVPEISDPSQLCGDLDLFQEIVLEYQLARYGSAVFPQPEPEMDITPFPDDYYSLYSSESAASETSTEDLNSDFRDSNALDSSLADESDVSSNPPAPAPPRKGVCLYSFSSILLYFFSIGKWRVKSLFQRAIMNLVQFLKGHKFSAKL